MAFTTGKRNELRVVRGATHTLEIRVFGPDGRPFELLEGDIVRFGVKFDDRSNRLLLKKEATTLENGRAWIVLEAEDTIPMDAGRYKYDVGLQSGAYYFPIVKYADLILEPNVTTKE